MDGDGLLGVAVGLVGLGIAVGITKAVMGKYVFDLKDNKTKGGGTW